ncbi:hypothetical protein [Prosthecodimorpha staleyi]|uniref:Uncharacterized protein n=1 Tax=Prosthecodimorpha staleyi TaxID=2840188 RepID=A0A947D838_9HYPH|nr:hypothetical protein [Prosthecodimorpha staleyi]MBT9291834.1 hypothetical protein [Prosthecodimorpha staleyi]
MSRPLPGAPREPSCVLGRMIPTSIAPDAVKAAGWRDHGLLVVALNDPRLGWADRELIRTIGEKLYGTREGRR